ncbi:MAG: hypothetical protein ACTSSG_14040 [Candidatus Heimdallarchaeaceae archaeon]
MQNLFLNKIRIKVDFPIRIVMVWTLVLIGMVLYSFAWYVFSIVAFSFIDAIVSSFNFGSQWNNITDLIKNLLYFHPVICLFGWILWGFLNSMRRDVREWET